MKETLNKRKKAVPELFQVGTDGLTNEQLLNIYLSLPKKKREEQFADTARAAQITGLSQRTIQFWIETGVIRAVHVGKKYQVWLDSLVKHLESQANKQTD